MLPSPAAQRRAALSATLDTIPMTRAFLHRPGLHPGHHLLVVRDGITYGELVRSYIHDLPAWARRILFHAIGVADPVDDPDGHARTRWWHPDWPISPVSIHLLESAAPGLVTPWAHSWLLSPPA